MSRKYMTAKSNRKVGIWSLDNWSEHRAIHLTGKNIRKR
jgi:hypothetical protein